MPRTPEQKIKHNLSNKAFYRRHVETLKKKSAEYRARNRDKCNARISLWKSRNKERILETERARWAKNRERGRARVKAWQKANPESYTASQKKWRGKNKVHVLNKNHIQRVRKRAGALGDQKVIVTWEKSWRSKKRVACYWCSKPSMGRKCHVDHIVALSLGGAHSIENLCVSCASCNLSKNNKCLVDWNKLIGEPVLF